MTTDVANSLGIVLTGKSQAYWFLATNNLEPNPLKDTVNHKRGVSYTPLQVETPLTGATVTVRSNVFYSQIAPAGPLATLTVNMPASPTDGQFMTITITEVITALTHSGNGNTIFEPLPVSLLKLTTATWYFRAATSSWYPTANTGGDAICVPGSSGTADSVVKFNGVDCQLVDSRISETLGVVTIITPAAAGDSAEIRLQDDDGSAYVSWLAPDIVAISTAYRLPDRSSGPVAGSALVISGAPGAVTNMEWTGFPPIECSVAAVADAIVKFSNPAVGCDAEPSTITQTADIVTFAPSGGTASQILLQDDDASHYVAIKAPPAVSTSIIYQWPTNTGPVTGSSLVITGAPGATTSLTWTGFPPVECATVGPTTNALVKFNGTDCDAVESAITEALSIVTIRTAAVGTDSSELRLEDDDGSAFVSWRAPPTVAASTTYILPDRSSGPVAGSALVVNGAPGAETDLAWTGFPPIECSVAATADAIIKFTNPTADCDAEPSTITQTGVAVNFNPFSGTASELRLVTAAGGFYGGFRSGVLIANRMWTLPINDGGAGDHLITDGGFTLSFSAVPAAFPSAHLNDLHVCVRPGETVQIDVLHADNDQLNINAATVVIIAGKEPLHAASALSVNGVTGVITYVADTRYLGDDYFMFEADEVAGSTLQQKATVHINIQETAPLPTVGNGAHFIFGDATANTSVRIYSGSSATTTALFNPGVGNIANGLATNRDDSLIYWTQGNNSTIRAYSYVEDVQFDVVADMSTLAVFSDAVAIHPGGGDVTTSVGATYDKGVYYLGGDSAATNGYFRIVMAKYIPGSSAQTVLDAQYIVFSDGLTRHFGDMQIDKVTGMMLVLSNVNAAATATGTISVVEPSSGTVLSRVPLIAPFDLTEGTTKQMVYGVNGELLVADEDDVAGESILRRLNAQTGGGSNYGAPNDIENAQVIHDMAEYIAQPCTASNFTTYPNLP